MLAHRFSYERFIGPIPAGMVVRHKNDAPLDINPLNLELGTRADNNQDRVDRGRSVYGEAHHTTTLSDSDVLEMRRLYAEGYRVCDLTARYPVSQSACSRIVRRKSWRYLP
jgi:hypothetical protein